MPEMSVIVVNWNGKHFLDDCLSSLRRQTFRDFATILGYEQSQGNLVVLLNNDTEVHPDWLQEIYRASQLFPRAGSFACKMLYFDERARIDNCGYWITRSGTTINIGRDEQDGPAYEDYRWVFGGCGG